LGSDHVGGLVGRIYSPLNISHSLNTGVVVGRPSTSGALIGYETFSNTATIANCYFDVQMTSLKAIGDYSTQYGGGYRTQELCGTSMSGTLSGFQATMSNLYPSLRLDFDHPASDIASSVFSFDYQSPTYYDWHNHIRVNFSTFNKSGASVRDSAVSQKVTFSSNTATLVGNGIDTLIKSVRVGSSPAAFYKKEVPIDIKRITLTIVAKPFGTVTGGGTYSRNEIATISATPDNDC
jgi:hypothetical protein